MSLDKKHVIAHPHQKITHFYWLLKGQINYYMILEETGREVLVSKMSEPFMPIGWGGFNSPYRFGMRLKVASTSASFYKVDMREIRAYVSADHNPFLIKKICSSLYHQMGVNVLMQSKKLEPKPITEVEPEHESYFMSPESSTDEIVALFRRSPFLSEFSETQLHSIALLAERREYERGEEVIEQDAEAEGLFVMIQGEVAMRRVEKSTQVNMRSISTPGFLFGWSSLIDEVSLSKNITTTKTSAYFLPKDQLLELLKKDQSFSVQFFMRLVWLIGNHLNVSFIRYLNLRLNHDVLAVQNLIFNAKSRLKLASPLHQVPHLLNHSETKPEAFRILHRLNKTGDSLEKHVASISLDLLKDEEREVKFLERLGHIYEVVAEKNNEHEDTAIVRKACASATQNLFKHLNYQIEGRENLPDEPGHIFIYNHLMNPPYYTLGNNFQITLDSHFISGVILDEKYEDPGIRTVRIGKGEEYGHQNYYERLGYINVYTKDSDSVEEDKKKEARSIFYKDANACLDQKMNLIISPEGTSYRTEESPGPFKTGTFRLALQRDDTLIVPIVMCFFDRRIPNNIFHSKILPPIRVKDHVTPGNEEELRQFVDHVHQLFQTEVNQARTLVTKQIAKEGTYE